MANKVQLKRSAVPGKIPTTTDIDLGEIAINTFDGKAYIKKSASGTESIVQLNSIGLGDVVGPSVSTDNAIARFDGITGKVIQDSTATIDDVGNVNALTFRANGTAANKFPAGTTEQRPGTPITGDVRFNTTLNIFEGYDGTNWVGLSGQPLLVDYLVVAGGGGGGGYGGGGAGGFRTESNVNFVMGLNYTITIGAGGTGLGGAQAATAGNGSNSVFHTITSAGGGGGAGDTAINGAAGGSGGGGNRNGGIGGAGNTPSVTPSQGNNGGGAATQGVGGGGGGANAVGGNSIASTGGAGGAGKQSDITGSLITYAGGGGSGVNIVISGVTTVGSGGTGGGGSGGKMNDTTTITAPQAGTANSGGGGGGRGFGGGTTYLGGNGGSGIVILRYPVAYTLVIGAGLTYTTTTIASKKVTIFTAGSDTVFWSL